MYCSRYDERFLAGHGEGIVYPDRGMQHFPLLEPARAVDLLSTGVHEFQQRKQEGENLELPIKLFLASFESKFIEEQLLSLFFALERLIGLESDSKAVIPARLFRPIAAEVSTAIERACEEAKTKIRQACGCEDVISMLLEKIGRLNQRSFWDSLHDTMNRYGVIWEDILDKDNPRSFVKLRDDLVHQRSDTDISQFQREKVRLRVLVERIVLKRIGCGTIDAIPYDLARVVRTAPAK